jgi:F-type H+-transporting ATPase subunit gamma
MANLRDIKRRIRSVQSTQQITRAMKMVATAKLRKAQAQVIAARPYSDKLREVLTHLAGSESSHPLLQVPESKTVGLVVFTADRGLCGGYNANLIRLAEQTKAGFRDQEVALITVGRKARDYFRRRGVKVIGEYVDLGTDADFIQARELAREFIRMYYEKQYGELYLVYARFVSPVQQIPQVVKLLPISAVEKDGEEKPERADYLYEPSAAGVLDTLLPRYVETEVYRMMLESIASEQGARMTAMSAATDNASEIIDTLTLTYNKASQSAITTELLEIVSGAEALK